LSAVGSSCDDELVKEMSITLLRKLRERWIPSCRRKSIDADRAHWKVKENEEHTSEKEEKDVKHYQQESDLKRQFNAKVSENGLET
jgi:hypothetical protein